jgi:GH15 family glucan-1,4-alpha-glucosidase
VQREGSTTPENDNPSAEADNAPHGGMAAPSSEAEGRALSRLPLRIEDYGLIGDCITAALVGRDGSIDWLCWPRFDSGACFAALLGDESNGRWRIGPAAAGTRSERSYRDSTMVLETCFENDDSAFAVIDFMPIQGDTSSIVRIVEGQRGVSKVEMSLTLRFDYGASVPWVEAIDDGIVAIAGPNLVVLRSGVPMHGEHFSTVAEFSIEEGERVSFVMSYGPSHLAPPEPIDVDKALETTQAFWTEWAGRCKCDGEYGEAVRRSLLTLKALTFTETGGMVAAPTMSLPEQIGGQRNWDYRYCWIRDATLTLSSFMRAGYYDEAKAWRDWLHRSLAGKPDDLQIMYGIGGERWLVECEVPWLPGYYGSKPVRVGNAAHQQLQLDVWGEMMGALHLAREGGLVHLPSSWELQRTALNHLMEIWREPDDGIWEVRGGRQHFVHSKVMAWLAFDCCIRDAVKFNLDDAPIDEWRATRDEIHRTVCEQGFSARKNSFTQSFGSGEIDASLLLIPRTGFLPIHDPRVEGTIKAIERELVVDGFVLRYRSETVADGLPAGEGVFLPCSFWLANAYLMQGRREEAETLLKRLLALRNDLGLLSEEYDTKSGRMVGNFPQAFSHLSLVHAVLNFQTGVAGFALTPEN